MPINISIVTTSAQIQDSNGVNGFGTITVTPSQAFSYNDGVNTIQVTANSTTVSVTDGQLDSALTLAPNTGASQSPATTYYIVDLDLNGTNRRELWQLANTPTSLEFTEVSKYSPNVSVTSASANPYRQYLLRSDTLDTPVAGTASDGRGFVPRGDTSNDNKLDPSWLGGSGSGGELTAADVPIVDAGGYYTGTDVEAALQEAGADLGTINTDIGNIESAYMFLLAACNMNGTTGATSEGAFDSLTGAYSNAKVDTTYLGSVVSIGSQTANFKCRRSDSLLGTYQFLLPTGYTKQSCIVNVGVPPAVAAGLKFYGFQWTNDVTFEVFSYDNTGTLADVGYLSVAVYKIGI